MLLLPPWSNLYAVNRVAAAKSNLRDPEEKLDDLPGVARIKPKLLEVMSFLQRRDDYLKFGVNVPKGLLISGAPAINKLAIVQALAREFGLSFNYFSRDDNGPFTGMPRLNMQFNAAKSGQPGIIYIDGLKAISAGSTAMDRSIYGSLLKEMDRLMRSDRVVVVATTQDSKELNSRLLHSKYFGYQITFPEPDDIEWEQIVRIELKRSGFKLPPGDSMALAGKLFCYQQTADIGKIINSAALMAVSRGEPNLTNRLLAEACYISEEGGEKIPARGTDDTLITAYHEAGHALLGLRCEPQTSLLYATAIPRRDGCGETFFHPYPEKSAETPEQLKGVLAMMMGGWAAEQIYNGDNAGPTNGIELDLAQATELARKMITKWGMSESEAVGRVNWDTKDVPSLRMFSQARVRSIEDESIKLVDGARQTAKDILNDGRDMLDVLALALHKHRILTGDEVRGLVAGTLTAAKL